MALDEQLLRLLHEEAVRQAMEEAERLQQLQSVEDCALYEQHMLAGVPCPLCGSGRLERRDGDLRCSGCAEMRAQLFDGSLSMDDFSDALGVAEDRHRQAGCSRRGACRAAEGVLCLQCEHCGWDEVAL